MFESLLNTTDATIDSFVFDAWNQFIVSSENWLTAMMVLFVVTIGFLLLLGRIRISLADLAPRFIKLLFIYVLVIHIPLLITFVFHLFTEVPASIATSLVNTAGSSEGGINGNIQSIFSQGMDSGFAVFEQGGLTNLGALLFALVIWLVTILVVTYITFLLILSKLATAILLAVAPFFIVLYLFDATKSIFEGWLRQTLSFALIPIFTYGLLALVLGMLTTMSNTMHAASSSQTSNFSHIAPYTVVMLISFLLFQQVMGWASGVAGGFSLSAVGAFGTAARGAAAYVTSGASLAYSAATSRTASKHTDPFLTKPSATVEPAGQSTPSSSPVGSTPSSRTREKGRSS